MKTTPSLGSMITFPSLPSDGGGGEGGTTNYNLLSNKPSINGIELIGNKTSEDLGLEAGGIILYTNLNESTTTVGGLKAGSTFDERTLQEMFDDMLYEEKYPSLTNPSSSFSFDGPLIVEVGQLIEGTFTTSFNRGSINPAYGTSGYRSGPVTQYNYTGDLLPSSVASSSNTDSHSLSAYTIDIPGTKFWTSNVNYSKGEQPLSSSGAVYKTALSAGITSTDTISITAVYPLYANTQHPNVMTKQPLSTPQTYYQLTLAGETLGSNKQSIEWWTGIGSLTGVQMFSIVTNTWEWLGGSKSGSLSGWTKENVTHGEVTYYKYVNNVAQVGSRQLRFYFK